MNLSFLPSPTTTSVPSSTSFFLFSDLFCIKSPLRTARGGAYACTRARVCKEAGASVHLFPVHPHLEFAVLRILASWAGALSENGKVLDFDSLPVSMRCVETSVLKLLLPDWEVFSGLGGSLRFLGDLFPLDFGLVISHFLGSSSVLLRSCP